MTGGQTEAGPRRRRRVVTLAGWELAVMALAVVLLPVSGLMVMGSDNCFDYDDRWICSATGQMTVVALPSVGIVLALLVIGVGGAIAIRRRRPLAPWISAGWIVVFVLTFVAWAIASAQPSPQTRQRQADQHAREATQQREAFVAGLRSRPDYEPMQAQFDQLQTDLTRDVPTASPTVSWPGMHRVDDYEQSCTFGQTHANRIEATSSPQVPPEQWTTVQAALDRRLQAYGFHPSRPDPPTEQYSQNGAWQRADGALVVMERYRRTPSVEVRYRTPCYVHEQDRGTLPQ